MSLDERLEWMKTHSRYRPVLGQHVIRVDGHLAAMGTADEFDDMLARFLMFIAREPRSTRTGGMG